MSKLTSFREKLNLTQSELAEKSGISVRTIQRIEAGTIPKGHTLKALAKALNIEEQELHSNTIDDEITFNETLYKIINISSLPGTFFPPLNIIFPLIIMLIKKEFTTLTKQILSLQIIYTVVSIILFLISSFIKNWLDLPSKFSLIVMILLALTNIFFILRNAMALDKQKKLYIKLGFSLI